MENTRTRLFGMESGDTNDLETPLLTPNGDEDDFQSVAVEAESNVIQNADENETEEPARNSRVTLQFSYDGVFRKSLLPLPTKLGGIVLVQNPAALNFLKFVALSLLWLVVFECFARKMRWEGDEQNTLDAIWQYQFPTMMLDMAVFFVVGRTPQVDTLEFVVVMMLGCIYTSFSYTFNFLDHSFTLYEMHCRWPASLWIYALGIVLVGVALTVLHVWFAIQQALLVSKLLEATLVTLAIVGPNLSSPYFHLHHWLAGWLIGMHLNFQSKWWSRIPQSWCWGIYINGIATYGRDPVLVCGFIDYMTRDLHCQATTDVSQQFGLGDGDDAAADWRNCSAAGYHP